MLIVNPAENQVNWQELPEGPVLVGAAPNPPGSSIYVTLTVTIDDVLVK